MKATNFFKTFQPFINKCKKSSLPILGYVKVEKGIATITDCETWVQFKTTLSDGMYNVINNEPFKQQADPDDFPQISLGPQKNSLLLKNPEMILKLATCAGNDELRPVMSGISLTNEYMVASDAHVLRWFKPDTEYITGDFNEIFLPTNPLLTRIKAGNDPVQIGTYTDNSCTNDANPIVKHIGFYFPDCTIIQRVVDGKYPNWQSIQPDWRHTQLSCFSVHTAVLADMVKTAKAFDRELMVVSSSGSSIQNIDLDLSKEWETVYCERPERDPDGVIMPMMINDESKVGVGISPARMIRCTTNFKGHMVVGWQTGDTCRMMAFWLEDQIEQIEYQDPAPTEDKAPEPQPTQMPQPDPEETRTEPEPEETRTEPEPEETRTEPAPFPTKKKVVKAAETIRIVQYSPKAIAVFGSTKAFREEFLKIWGRWIPLSDPTTGTKTHGWIFSAKRENQVKQILKVA